MPTISSLLLALIVFALILLHVVVLGSWGLRWTKVNTDSSWAKIGVGGSLGITLLGFEMLLLGHADALTEIALSLSSILMGIGLSVFIPSISKHMALQFSQAVICIRREKVLAFSCGLIFVLVAISSMRPPMERDELDYHWAAPVLWAHTGHWIASPYRLTNGPALAEMLYTFSACFHSPVAAHWTHAFCLLILTIECAALARSLGGTPLAAAAACLSCPVIVNQASIAYNDVAAATLVLGAYIALYCRRQNVEQDVPIQRGNVVAAALLIAGAASVKPFTLAALPAALLYIFCSGTSLNRRTRIDKVAIQNMLVFCGIIILVLGVWSLHTYSLIGKVWDSSGKYMVRHVSDPMWQTGAAAGRIPNLLDIFLLPTVPFVTGILGQKEPYGGRTGLVLMLFVPIGLAAIRYKSNSQRTLLYWLLGSACTYFLLLGSFAIKTRFHIFVWCAGICIAAVGYQRLRQIQQMPLARLGIRMYYVLMWIGMADTIHVLCRKLYF